MIYTVEVTATVEVDAKSQYAAETAVFDEIHGGFTNVIELEIDGVPWAVDDDD